MKIPGPEEMRNLDESTIKNQGITSTELMERAALRCLDALLNDLNMIAQLGKPSSGRILIFCGNGNNGGDGLVIARHLFRQGFSIGVFLIDSGTKNSPENALNLQRLKDAGFQPLVFDEHASLPQIEVDDIVIDAIFGFGLNRKTEGNARRIIEHLNASSAKILSVDVPSGLFCNDNRINDSKGIVHAYLTYTFHSPKLAFFFPENAQFVGQWKIIDIGLETESLSSGKSDNVFVESEMLIPYLKKRSRFAHKGSHGHSLLIAGSRGKTGAAILASVSCMRSGTGKLSVAIPHCGETALHVALPDAMIIPEEDPDKISRCPDLGPFNAVAMGPGIGTDKQSGNALKVLIQQSTQPLVLDADALNLLAENKTWLSFLPANTILTPHPGEFDRLFGKHSSGFDRWETQKEMAIRYKIIIILKGAYTCTVDALGNSFFNSSGNPGMAKAGSGDVLTGIILGLLSRGHQSLIAALLGVYLHGRAADLLAMEKGMESLLASEINQKLPDAFQEMYQSVM